MTLPRSLQTMGIDRLRKLALQEHFMALTSAGNPEDRDAWRLHVSAYAELLAEFERRGEAYP